MRKDKLDIIFEDKNIVVVNKPAHLLTVSTEKEHEKTLFHKVSDYEKTKHKSNKVFIVHRLDKDTSGVVVFAKNLKVKSLLQNNWDNLVKSREYIAIVEGKMDKNKGTIKSWLKENKNYVTYSSMHPGDGKLAITKYQLIAVNNKYSLLKINIDTGRKNQIRVHMKYINHPVTGDEKYGRKCAMMDTQGQCLHAYQLTLVHPSTHQKMTFTAPLPDYFETLLEKLRREDI